MHSKPQGLSAAAASVTNGQTLPRWQQGARVLLACLVLLALWSWVGQEPQRQWQPAATIHVTAAGQHYRLSKDEMAALQNYSVNYFREQAEQGQGTLQQSTEAHLDQLFARVEGQIPAFLDWYYSLPASYGRTGMWIASQLGWQSDDYVRERAEKMLFHDSNWQGSMMRLETRARAELAQHDAVTRKSWLAGVMEQLEPHQVPSPLPSSRPVPSVDRPIFSVDALEQQLAQASVLSMNERLSVSTGGAVAGAAIMRGAVRGAAALSARQAAARGAGRGAARAGSAAAGGVVACAPGGPVALGCALAAGTVAWLTIDWAMLKAEEGLRRDALEAALKDTLQELRLQVEADIQSALAADAAQHQQLLQSNINREFLPMQALRANQK